MDISYIINAYGFTLIPFGKKISAKEFAELIKKTYSLDESRNKWAYDFLMNDDNYYYRDYSGIGTSSQPSTLKNNACLMG